MKVTKQMLITAGLLLMSAAAAPAQNLKANIPFDFYAGGKKLPAGTYMVQRAMELQSFFSFRFRPMEGTTSTLVATPVPIAMGSPAVPDSRLLFRCAAGECEIAEIWSEQYGTKVGTAPSKRFKGVHTEIASVPLQSGL